MASVRLKISMIIDGKLHARGSVLDEALVPKDLRIPDYIAYPDDRGGQVMALRELHFSSLRPMSDGVITSFPITVMAGQLIDLATVPVAYRESLKEGTDYKADWTYEEQQQLLQAEEEAYLKQFNTEPEVPTGISI